MISYCFVPCFWPRIPEILILGDHNTIERRKLGDKVYHSDNKVRIFHSGNKDRALHSGNKDSVSHSGNKGFPVNLQLSNDWTNGTALQREVERGSAPETPVLQPFDKNISRHLSQLNNCTVSDIYSFSSPINRTNLASLDIAFVNFFLFNFLEYHYSGILNIFNTNKNLN